jgi:hypothetical protein
MQVSIGGAKSSMAYSILRKIARFQSAVHSASLRFFWHALLVRYSCICHAFVEVQAQKIAVELY